MPRSHTCKGFTLIELAIVITIIAFLIGGITVGRNMIRNSQLQSVTKDVARYTQAIGEFRDKYLAQPGDFAGAESLWGTDPGGCPATPANSVLKTATCNGDGDGHAGNTGGSTALGNVTAGWYETFRVWQHLSNAGFIGESYSGSISDRTPAIYPGISIPASRISGAGYMFTYLKINAETLFKDSIVMGTPDPAAPGQTAVPYMGAVTPEEAMAIDTKMDNGAPHTGTIQVFSTAILANCTMLVSGVAQYNASASGNLCSLIFTTGN